MRLTSEHYRGLVIVLIEVERLYLISPTSPRTQGNRMKDTHLGVYPDTVYINPKLSNKHAEQNYFPCEFWCEFLNKAQIIEAWNRMTTHLGKVFFRFHWMCLLVKDLWIRRTTIDFFCLSRSPLILRLLMLARFESLKKRTHLLDVYLIAQNITVGQGGTITGLNVGLII